MREPKLRQIIVIGILICLIPQLSEAKDWQVKMRETSKALNEVLPYLYPNGETNAKGISEKLQTLYQVSQELNVEKDHVLKAGDFDPALPYLTKLLKEDIERAYLAQREGNMDYVRYVLKGTTNYCVTCHTRLPESARLPLSGTLVDLQKSVPWITKIELQAASRQYNEVRGEVLSQARANRLSVSGLDLERAARLALTAAIRVHQDPGAAIKLSRALASAKNASPSLKSAAQDWLRDLQDWARESSRKGSIQAVDAADELLKRAAAGDAYGHHEVLYLRASALLHQFIRQYPSDTQFSRALYLLGEAYAPMQDLGTWNLHEKYFRACILEVPHTKLAEKCYQRFESSVLMGYSGSAGLFLPYEIQRELKELKRKSNVIKEDNQTSLN